MIEYEEFVKNLSTKLVEVLNEDWEGIQDLYNKLAEDLDERENMATDVPLEFYLLRSLLILKQYNEVGEESTEAAT